MTMMMSCSCSIALGKVTACTHAPVGTRTQPGTEYQAFSAKTSGPDRSHPPLSARWSTSPASGAYGARPRPGRRQEDQGLGSVWECLVVLRVETLGFRKSWVLGVRAVRLYGRLCYSGFAGPVKAVGFAKKQTRPRRPEELVIKVLRALGSFWHLGSPAENVVLFGFVRQVAKRLLFKCCSE